MATLPYLFDYMIITNVITIINTFILFSLLFFRKDNPLPNKILAFIFLIPGLYFIDNILILTGNVIHVPYFFFFVQIIAIIYPTLVYLYVCLIIGEKTTLNPLLTSGSILLLTYIIHLTICFYNLDNFEKTNYLASLSNENYPEDMMLYTVLFYIWQMVYFSILTFKVNTYDNTINDFLSNIDSIQITFAKRFMMILWALNIGLILLYLTLPLSYVDYFFLPVIVSVIYIFILYFSFHHNSIFTQQSLMLLKETNKSIEASSGIKKNLNSTDKHQKIYEMLKKVIEVDKEYKNPELTLKSIAEKLDMPAYLVSQTINLYYKKNFFDLINECRITDAKNRLTVSDSKDKIETIAYEVGFNSRATFYRAYKRYTGETPTGKTND